MKAGTREKLTVFALSFVLFMLGAYAVYMDRGSVRTATLAVALVGLLSVAVWQTVRRLKKGK